MPHLLPPSSTFQLVMRFWRDFLRVERGRLLISLLLIGVVAATTGAYPVVIKWAIDALEMRNLHVLTLVPVVIIAVTLVKGLAFYAQAVVTNTAVLRVVRSVQKALMARFLSEDLGLGRDESPASLAARFTNDLNYVRDGTLKCVSTLVRDVLTVVVLVGVLFWLDWVLALVAVFILPLAAFPIDRVGRKIRVIVRAAQDRVAQMSARVIELISGLKMIKSYQIERYAQEQANDHFDAIYDLQLKAINTRARLEPLMEVLGGLAIGGVFWIVGQRIGAGETSIGNFTGFISALLLAAQSVRGLGNLHLFVQEGLSAYERILHILDAPVRVMSALEAPALSVSAGAVTFSNVGFVYDDGTRALSEVSFTACSNQTTALVGASGAGKSTVFHLMNRFDDVSEGLIEIDGYDLRAVSLTSLRQQISLVSQDAVIFDDTVFQNIVFGRDGATRDDVETAAQQAGIHERIVAMAEGYNTRVRSDMLSGGEKQRIALARAFLKDAPILLLDEATASLDAETEARVQQALGQLKQGRTTLVIAHRLSTIRDADQILVMDGGLIVERGTHQLLLDQGGVYARLCALQFGAV